MTTSNINRSVLKLFTLLTILLFINLPLISALEISVVQAQDITSNSAFITWKTDEPADSFTSYGKDKTSLQKIGDAALVKTHTIPLENLNPETEYFYKVESNDIADDNKGALYTFKTPAPDTTPPILNVTAPSAITGTTLDISGTTEPNTILTLYLNGKEISSKKSVFTIKNENQPLPTTVPFTFLDVTLIANQPNKLKIEAVDKSNNKAIWEQTITTDNKKPEITLKSLPTLTASNSITLEATISEESSYEILLNNKSVAKNKGTTISQQLSLKEGSNQIEITATDAAGLTATKTATINSDNKQPFVKFTIEKGINYYEGTGKAVSNIHGTTKPGATVYLFIYTPTNYEFPVPFDKAWAKVTANDKGEFTFSSVDFSSEKIDLFALEPKQVAPSMEKITIAPVDIEATKLQTMKYVYIIAEDQLGRRSDPRSGSTTISLNKCTSISNDFSIISVPQFQAPLRINPTSLDQGRETIQAVFKINYLGAGLAPTTTTTTTAELPFQINSVEFEKACTPGMMKDPQFKTACNLLPVNARQKVPNADKTSWFISFPLHSSEKLSEKKDTFWNEFQKRQIMFPLKIRVNYQERGVGNQLGEIKTQIFCTDLGYFVDIPLESKDYIPDYLANATIESTAFVMRQIDNVMPYLETSIKIFGVGCIGSFLGKNALRWARFFTSKTEFYFDKINKDKKAEEKCPSPAEQNKLLLDSTVDDWLKNIKDPETIKSIDKQYGKDVWPAKTILSLNKRCPKTAALWSAESKLDTIYRWSCDRVFCRSVPAGLTAKENKEKVDQAILAQQQCASTSSGIPLQLMENCQEMIKQDTVAPTKTAEYMMSKGTFTCYRADNKLYVIDTDSASSDPSITKLKLVKEIGLSIEQHKAKYAGESNLFAYKPPGAENMIVGKDQTCANACKNPRRPGYKADLIGSVQSSYLTDEGKISPLERNGCYREGVDTNSNTKQLFDASGQLLKGQGYSAGYTKDCFIELNAKGERVGPDLVKHTTGLLQCVCTQDKKAVITPSLGAREAGKKDSDGNGEDWDYQQYQLFRESHGVFGTYYPEWRYYSSRDRSQAFGADYLTDYLRDEGKKQFPAVNPKTQYLGAIQGACLSTIRADLVMLRSILQGLNSCMVQAKRTGLRDAGVCKTLFTQHVCGLLYKGIAALNSGCTTYNFDDVGKESTLEGVSEVSSALFSSIPQAMQSSIDEVKGDYGNAKLNEYFATGAQGFAQSMCMAAFGFDWPMGMDFIEESAYSVSTKTVPLAMPTLRELSTYDPASGNAVYNYEIGALILPGCKLRSADVYLKCVGIEDIGKPGVKCGSQGCDCLQASQKSPFESEKIKYLEQGKRTNLAKGQMIDMKLPSPQKVSSHYRYDHVIIELTLDRYEDAANCFDSDTTQVDKNSKKAQFYFPLSDVSPPGEFTCTVDIPSGRYICPDAIALFGGGANAYIEDPYTSCYDKTSGSFVNCDTPNLFIKGDTIRVKNHLFLDSGKYCLKNTVSGLTSTIQEYPPKLLPQQITGPFSQELNLGTVRPELFGGATSNIILNSFESDPTCAQPQIDEYGKSLAANKFRFTYEMVCSDYRVHIPTGVTVLLPFDKKAGTDILIKKDDSKETFKPEELLQVKYDLAGVRVHNLIGPATGNKGCTYDVSASSSTSLGLDKKAISITTELLLPDEFGSCYGSTQLVKAPSAYGKAKHTQNIIIQLQPIAGKIINTMHDEFMAGNCNYVQLQAESIIQRKLSDIEDAQAIFYSVACFILDGKVAWPTKYKSEVCARLNTFYNRQYLVPPPSAPYPVTVTNTAEYQKIAKYLSEINLKAGCGFATGTPPTSSTPSPNTLCGKSGTKAGFAQPPKWNEYTCREQVGFESSCLGWKDYSTDGKKGCTGTQRCCPPKPGSSSSSSGGGTPGVDQKCGSDAATFVFGTTPENYASGKVPPNWNSYTCQISSVGDTAGKLPYGIFDFNTMCFGDSIVKHTNPTLNCGLKVCCPPGTS